VSLGKSIIPGKAFSQLVDRPEAGDPSAEPVAAPITPAHQPGSGPRPPGDRPLLPPLGVTGPRPARGASVTERPGPEPGTGSYRRAGRLVGWFAAVRPGARVEGASGPLLTLAVLPESRKCLSKPQCLLELAAYMNVSPQFSLKPESAYFSVGLGNVHPLPNYGSSNTWATGRRSSAGISYSPLIISALSHSWWCLRLNREAALRRHLAR